MPWLVGTALLHSLRVVEVRDAFKAWVVFLAIAGFALSLIGTFLVRSGVLVSVHAFAVDPWRGTFILVFLAIIIGGALLIYAWRGPRLAQHRQFNLLSRETLLLANNVLLFSAMLTVLLGTLYPLIIEVLGGGKISVGAPYFNTVFIPLFLPLLLLMGLGPLVYWQGMDPRCLLRRLWSIVLIAVIFAALVMVVVWRQWLWGVTLAIALAVWIIAASLVSVCTLQPPYYLRFKSRSLAHLGMLAAHIGVACCLLGVVISTHFSEERQVQMHLGEKVNLHDYQFTLRQIEPIVGKNYQGVQAEIVIDRQGYFIATLAPQLRIFPQAQVTLAKTAIDKGLWRDLYVALGAQIDNNTWALRFYYKPMVRWIWFGGMLIALGAVLALADRKRLLSAIPLTNEDANLIK